MFRMLLDLCPLLSTRFRLSLFVIQMIWVVLAFLFFFLYSNRDVEYDYLNAESPEMRLFEEWIHKRGIEVENQLKLSCHCTT